MALPPHVVELASDDDRADSAVAAFYHAAPSTTAPPTLRYRLDRRGADDWTAVSPSKPPFGPTTLGEAWAFLEWRAIEDVLNDPGPDAVFIHAAGVRIAGRLVLLVGASGSGKSTLTALLLARGHATLGDDVLRFTPEGGIFGAVPRSLKIDGKLLKDLGVDAQRLVAASPGTLLAAGCLYVSPEALCRDWKSEPGSPWGVVVLENAPHRGSASLARRREGEAAVRLLQSLLGAAHRAAAGADVAGVGLLESIRDAVAYEAHGSDAVGLAELIVEAATA